MNSNRAVVVTISDRCAGGQAEDRSGPAMLAELDRLDAHPVHRAVVPDEVDRIQAVASGWLGRCEIILCSGGTGVAPRDVTPEAIEPLLERRLPGFGEAMRMLAFERTPRSIVSRGGAGIARNTLVVYMPGSPKAVKECLEWLAPAIKEICAFLRGAAPH